MVESMAEQGDKIKKIYQEIHSIQHSSNFSVRKYNRALKRLVKAINEQAELMEIAE